MAAAPPPAPAGPRNPNEFVGLALLVIGALLAAGGLLLYLVFLGLVAGVTPDHVVALTNLVAVTVGAGLACTGAALLKVPARK